MTINALILELLGDISPDGYCDDCLSRELAIQPRQTVNQQCRVLAAQGRIERVRRACAHCSKFKISNIAKADTAVSRTPAAPSKTEQLVRPNIDIEKTRTEIVRICRELWRKSKQEDPPRSVSQLINTLRNEGLLPSHPANMMLTLCGLRNVYVYEGLEFSEKEVMIGKAAYEIVSDWWYTMRR